MIYLIIGPSCSGKSTFIKNTWIRNSKIKEEGKQILPYTIVDDAILLGKYFYDSDTRTVGGDRVERLAWEKIVEWIKTISNIYPQKDVVIDGFKALTYKSMEDIVRTFNNIHLILITCSRETSIIRNIKCGSKSKYSSLKAAYTISHKLFAQYRNKVQKSNYIFTDNFDEKDFKDFEKKIINNKVEIEDILCMK